MKICFRCNAVNIIKLSDHKPECPLIRDKKNSAKSIKDIVNRYNHRNKALGDRSLGRVNKPGCCKRCGKKVTSLLTHISVCRSADPTSDFQA